MNLKKKISLLKKNNQFNTYYTLFFFVHIESIFNNLFLYSYNTNFFKLIELFPEFIFLVILTVYLIFSIKQYNDVQYNSWVLLLLNIFTLYIIKISV